ncbi:hypothetical protein QTP88_016711 [Uroleucon formosanum]
MHGYRKSSVEKQNYLICRRLSEPVDTCSRDVRVLLRSTVGDLTFAWRFVSNPTSCDDVRHRVGRLSDQIRSQFYLVFIKMSCDEDALLAAAAFIVIANKKIKKAKPRRFWVRPSLQSREIYTKSHLLSDLISDDTDILNLEYKCNGGFRNFFRMSPSQFNE